MFDPMSENEKQENRPNQSGFMHLMDVAANKKGFSRTFRSIRVCHHYREYIRDTFSQDAMKGTNPLYFKDGILTVGVENSAWAQQILMHQHLILEAMNYKLGGGMVKSIKIRMLDKSKS
jgi:predicted nucleic acid-binding Zn ribbon protein